MGFIKILRWRIGGALHRLGRRPQPIDIGSFQRAAVFIFGLGREHAALVLEELAPEESRPLVAEVNLFSEVDERLSREVWDEFLDGLPVDELPDYVSRREPDELVRAFVRSDPQSVAQRLRYLWLDEDDLLAERGDDDDDALELGYDDLEPAQKAGVFMMWLPPELSAMVLQKFSPNQVHLVTSILVELPFVIPKARELVLTEFMEGVTLGIPGLSIEDVGLPVVVEAFVRSDPDAVSKRLEAMWLSGSTVVVPAAPVEQPPENTLTSLEKCAVFFQSLSLPLAYHLLAEMEPEEVEPLLETIDNLRGIDADTRKQVLQELMLASKPGLRDEPQPIHILGKAMGQMIRRRPSVVLRQIRKHWFGA
jgi:FliG N-terminal domain